MQCVLSHSVVCLTLCGPKDYSPPGSTVHEISQGRIVEWIAISYSRGSSQSRDWTRVSFISCTGSGILYHQHHLGNSILETGVVLIVLITQLCTTLCDPMDCSPPGSSVHGILQARIPEWVAIPFSRGSSQPRDQTQILCTAGGFFTTWATINLGILELRRQ